MTIFTSALFGLACGAALGAGPVVDSTTAVVRVHVESLERLAELEAMGAEPLACRVGVGEQLMSMDSAVAAELVKLGAVMVEPDVESALAAAAAGVRGGGFFDDYQTFDAINVKLDEMAMNARVEIVVVGDTLEGRTVRGVRITNGSGGVKPAVLVNGAQHAREWISPASVMFLADRLVNEYGVDGQITGVLDAVDFIIVPVVNADGYVYTFTAGNRLWRKNRRDNGGGSFGVDPNRNWAEGWGLSSGSSGNTNSNTYRGPVPFSEPCTANMRDFIQSRPEIRAHVDVHNFAQLILGAWAYTDDAAPDAETMLPLGEVIETAMVGEFGSFFDFRTGAAGIGFASGAMPDWTFGELGVMSWTFELRDTGAFAFQLPVAQLVPASMECVAGVMRVAEQIAHCPNDLNLDGVVDATDLAIVLSRWGNQRGLSDVDLSGVVDSADLANLLAAWGSGCGI